MRNESYIDRIFRKYGEEEFGIEVMAGITSEQVEEARCAAMRALAEMTRIYKERQHKDAAKLYFCEYLKFYYLDNTKNN